MSANASSAQARSSASPRPGRRLPGGRFSARLSVLLQRELTRMLDAPSREVELGQSPYTLVTTFRRDGTPVAVPVWAALENGTLYVRTERESGKVKRLAHDGRAELAPCNAAGRRVGPATPAHGRILPTAEEAIAERALTRRYGRLREAFERAVDLLHVDMCYLELAPIREEILSAR